MDGSDGRPLEGQPGRFRGRALLAARLRLLPRARQPVEGARRAVIDERKVRDYLLSSFHPAGRFKARLLARAGFRESDWKVLMAELRRIAAHGITAPGQPTPHGRKYVVWGTLRHGDGIALPVLTVWIVTSPGRPPRFVTLIPRRG